MDKVKIPGRLPLWKIIIFAAAPVVCGLVCLCIGRIHVPISDMLISLSGGEIATKNEMVLWNMRLPRILTAALVGAGLSVSGCVFQSMFSNPLATPDTLGVASGASFGAALALLMGFGMAGVQAVAFTFGLAAVILTYICGKSKSESRAGMILAGIMIGSLFSALVSLVKFAADTESELPAITYWLMGSLSSSSMQSLKLGAPAILTGIVLLLLLRWKLNLLPLAEDEARTFGTNIKLLRAAASVCAAAMTAACVSMCGQVGWVGLLVPHICRMRYGSNHAALLPACVSLGAVFMMLVDTLARSISAAEIPVSILTAIIGAPVFIAMVRKSGGWSL